uniref:Thioredoxin domain-containing protein n=1 Tax=Rhabditophanes sp. KR3021 TaxID=114890 RepID=A0AC35TMB0_9BILA
MNNAVAQQILNAAKAMEQQIDQQMAEYENLDDGGLEEIRKKRIAELKKMSQQKTEWLANGHSKYTELTDEKEFFEAAKKSRCLVCHFYKNEEVRCKVVDKLLKQLAAKHLGTRFVQVNSDKFPFLITRLNIRITPTIGIAIDSKMVDYVRVFEELGKNEDIPIELLEQRLAMTGVIEGPPKKIQSKAKSTKIIRGKLLKDDSDSD